MAFMALLATNPTQLQHAAVNATPLFLIHDGGGTIFKYFLLGDLHRDVYGIHDPKFECEDSWEGGISEMAKAYLILIKAVKDTGPIILGGWSLGGLVALQIARLIDDERQHRHLEQGTCPLLAVGVILIDSPYSLPDRDFRGSFASFEPDFPTWTPKCVRENVIRRFAVSDRLLKSWDPPRWEARLGGAMTGNTPRINSSDLCGQHPNPTAGIRPKSTSPPVVLLKAMERVPLTQSEPERILQVDMFRDTALLGWEYCAGSLVETVHHVSGHHFDLFDGDEKVEIMTEILKHTCEEWGSLGF